jgi:uncharacterized protein (TIGR01777 family)
VTVPDSVLPPVILAGGSGALGLRVARYFTERGHQVVILTRQIRSGIPYRQMYWDGLTVDASWGSLLPGSILVNLAGELVDRVPTRRNVRLLKRSRVNPTAALATASRQFGGPSLWLQMSTLAIYGDAGDAMLTEEDGIPADGPAQMAGVAKAWEAALFGAVTDRLVILRAGVVLDRDTPALNRLIRMTRMFMGGTVGSGEQYVSWIHADDFVAAVGFITDHPDLDDVVHVTAWHAVTNKDFMAAFREALGMPWMPPTPAWLVKIGARLLFRTDPALALLGRCGVPGKLDTAGFSFRYPTITKALEDLIAERL